MSFGCQRILGFGFLLFCIALAGEFLSSGSADAVFNVPDAVPGQVHFLGIDADPTGNTPSSVASVESSVSPAGATFQIDIVIDEADFSRKLGGIYGSLLYDPSRVRVVADAYPMFSASPGPDFFLSDPLPDADGDFLVQAAKFIGNPFGEGVPARLTFECVSLGSTQVTLGDTFDGDGSFNALDQDGYPLLVTSFGSPATVNCTTFAPSVTPSPPPVPTPEPSSSPGRIDLLAIDADPTGNSASSLGPTDTSHTADLNDFPEVDLVVDAIHPEDGLGGIQGDLFYDPSIVHIQAHDVDFLAFASGYGSPSVLQDLLPDSDGAFRFGFVNPGDPNPESGKGVLSRITLYCVGIGTSVLHLTYTDYDIPKPHVLDPEGTVIPITTIQDATITCLSPIGGSVNLAVSSDTSTRLGIRWFIAGSTALAVGVAGLAAWRLSRRRTSP